MPVAALDSGPLAYREVGPPDGPIALLVHGVLVGGTVWSRTEAELCARG
jgi:pimeloyl-ACP methyl ester carboxylesterase